MILFKEVIMTKTEKRRQYHAEWYQKNKERLRLVNKKWAEENKEKDRACKAASYHRRKKDPLNIVHYLLKHAKARAKQRGIEYSLTPEDIILPEVCPVMQVPFIPQDKKYTYSLDRKDSAKGYTKDNVWVISLIANSMKWSSTKEERVLFAKWVLSLEGGELSC